MNKQHDHAYAHDTATSYLQLLQGKKVVITGGTTGIGRATAVLLAAYGTKLLIFGRHEPELQDALQDVRGVGGSILGLTADQATQAGVDAVFDKVDRELGGVDVLINNAAVGGGSVVNQKFTDLSYVINTNVVGYLAFAKQAYLRMQKQRSGYIINIGSLSADEKEAGSDIYVATKGAIRAFSESFAKQVNPQGIRVSLIEPGSVGTDMSSESPEQQRDSERHMAALMAEDIANAILYCLTQPNRVNISLLQIRPTLQEI